MIEICQLSPWTMMAWESDCHLILHLISRTGVVRNRSAISFLGPEWHGIAIAISVLKLECHGGVILTSVLGPERLEIHKPFQS